MLMLMLMLLRVANIMKQAGKKKIKHIMIFCGNKKDIDNI